MRGNRYPAAGKVRVTLNVNFKSIIRSVFLDSDLYEDKEQFHALDSIIFWWCKLVTMEGENLKMKMLVALEVENFKSFRGFHRISPLKSFTAVVGPNGSGKCIHNVPYFEINAILYKATGRHGAL